MTDNTIRTGDAQHIIEAVKDLSGAEIIYESDPHGPDTSEGGPIFPFAVLPREKRIHSLKEIIDEWRIRPERRRGTAKLQTLDALIAHANRFKDDGSALFGTITNGVPALTSVLDYHPAGGAADAPPRFGEHRGQYDFPLSDEWRAWMGAADAALSQVEFAEFLEDRITDVTEPPAWALKDAKAKPQTPEDIELAGLLFQIGGRLAGSQRLMEMARSLKIHENSVVKNASNLATGEVSLQFETTHTDADGKPLTIPNIFLITIPIFAHGAGYRLVVRLRYRKPGGKIVWLLAPLRPDVSLRHAAEEAFAKAAADTGLPLYRGSPE